MTLPDMGVGQIFKIKKNTKKIPQKSNYSRIYICSNI